MLTTLEANFIQEYKQTGNASEAVRRSYGSRLTNPKSASVIATRLLKKPHIREVIDRASVNQMLAVTSPTVNYPSRLVSKLPSKDEYALKAWERSSDESTLKDDTKHKYFETAGKVLGHIGNNDSGESRGDAINIICKELHLSLANPQSAQSVYIEQAPQHQPADQLAHPPIDGLINNQIDMTNNQERAEQSESKAE